VFTRRTRSSIGLSLLALTVASIGACTTGDNPDGDATSAALSNVPAVAFQVEAASACPASFESGPRAGSNSGFSAGGQTRSFQLLLPPASFSGPRPILFGFHGTSENGARFVARAKLADFTARGFIVVAPDAAQNGEIWPVWDAMRLRSDEGAPNADLQLFDKLLSCTAAHYAVDQNRIFATGHSAGGIFTNRLLRSRSSVLAGGIVASGILDLTGTDDKLDSLFALVTWGGDNDAYSGSTSSGVNVPSFSFVEQASLASKFYESHAAQAHCRGNNLGHAWLPLNGWFVDVLLAHPKGAPSARLPPLPSGAPASCSDGVFELPPLPEITCPSTSRPGCMETCQLIADCAVDNRTIGPALAHELQTIGFNGSSCGGCVQRCQLGGGGDADGRVLSCIAGKQAHASCGPGLEGAEPLLDAVNQCCDGASGSLLCGQVCAAIGNNSVAKAFFPVCEQF
jgi:poly(3-hydroxybutyrate) depolymerase